MKTRSTSLAFLTAVVLLLMSATARTAENTDLASQLSDAIQKASGETHELKYRFTENETIRYKVEHLVTVETTIEENRQRARSRSVSTKQWDIQEISDSGNAKLVHQVADADMWQQIIMFVTEDGKQVSKEREVRYNSSSDADPPLQYEKFAATVGKPLAEVVVDAHGQLIQREDKYKGTSWGGQLVVPLPPKPVAVGHKWHKPQEIVIRLKDGRVKRIKTRQQYELISVKDGIAKIGFETQLITPGIRDQPKILVQIVQRLTSGNIEFDIDAGRIVRQHLKLNETVIGFNGAKSIMNYTGRFNEELITDADEIGKTAAK